MPRPKSNWGSGNGNDLSPRADDRRAAWSERLRKGRDTREVWPSPSPYRGGTARRLLPDAVFRSKIGRWGFILAVVLAVCSKGCARAAGCCGWTCRRSRRRGLPCSRLPASRGFPEERRRDPKFRELASIPYFVYVCLGGRWPCRSFLTSLEHQAEQITARSGR